MAKVEADGLMVREVVPVSPSADAVTVTAPAPPAAPVAVMLSWPLAFVVPDDGVSVTFPVPVLVKVTAALGTTLPPASFAVTVKVTGDAPSSGRVVPVEVTVIVEPTICTGICADMAPAVAVMVAVRLILLEPEEKVTVAVPAAPVTTVADPSTPVSALMVTVTPCTAAFAVFNAVTVIVVEVDPSDLTVVGDAKRSRDAAVTVGVTGVVVVPPVVAPPVVVPPPPPPQPASNAMAAANKNDAENLVFFLPNKRFT